MLMKAYPCSLRNGIATYFNIYLNTYLKLAINFAKNFYINALRAFKEIFTAKICTKYIKLNSGAFG